MELTEDRYNFKINIVLVEGSENGLPSSMTEIRQYGSDHLPKQGEFILLNTLLFRVEGFVHSTEDDVIRIIVTKKPMHVYDADGEPHSIIHM